MGSILVGQLNPTVNHIIDGLGGNQSQQGVFTPLDIPTAEDRALGRGSCRMDFTVATRIVAIAVRKDARIDQGMIHRRIEGDLLVLGPSLNADAAEFVIPSLMGLLTNGVEIPAGNFCHKIGPSSFDANIGNTCFQENGFTRRRRELGIEADVLPFFLTTSWDYFGRLAGLDEVGVTKDVFVGTGRQRGAPDANIRQQFTELRMIIDRKIWSAISMPPAASIGGTNDFPFDGAVAHHLHGLLKRGAPRCGAPDRSGFGMHRSRERLKRRMPLCGAAVISALTP